MNTNYKKLRIDELYVEYADDFGMWTKHLDDMSSSELPFEIEDWMYDYAMEKQKENFINEGDLVLIKDIVNREIYTVTSIDGIYAELNGYYPIEIGKLQKVK